MTGKEIFYLILTIILAVGGIGLVAFGIYGIFKNRRLKKKGKYLQQEIQKKMRK
jgi:hypothetical protein